IFSEVFTSWIPTFLEVSEGSIPPSDELGPEEQALLTETVNKITAVMTENQLQHFRLLVAGCSYDEISKNLLVSRPTEIKRRTELFQNLEKALASLNAKIQKSVMVELFLYSRSR